MLIDDPSFFDATFAKSALRLSFTCGFDGHVSSSSKPTADRGGNQASKQQATSKDLHAIHNIIKQPLQPCRRLSALVVDNSTLKVECTSSSTTIIIIIIILGIVVGWWRRRRRTQYRHWLLLAMVMIVVGVGGVLLSHSIPPPSTIITNTTNNSNQ